MPITGDTFRQIMGTFASGVTVITAEHNDEIQGLTANSFTSVSMDPPLVLFCAAEDSRTNELLEENPRVGFTVNILAENQEELSNRFANPGLTMEERLDGKEYEHRNVGGPVFEKTLAWLECERESEHVEGDHIIYVGRVIDGALQRDARPILYYQGDYGQFKLFDGS